MIINNYLDYIQEAFIFSDENLLYKFKEWKSGKNKVLLITGYSGSGKTTLGQKLAKEHNAEYNELDTDAIYKGKFDKSVDGTEKEDIRIRKYILDRLNKVKKQSVWEGCYMLAWLSPEDFSKYSVLMVGTSITKSSIQAAKRRIESNKKYPGNKYPVHKDVYITTKFNIKELMSFYNKLWKYLKAKIK